ncbi:Up-regulated during septation-domain-containing protein [Amylocarpus encephaloides]|uniref:Up-regulated during septation-domain-containing protein n=1 Tax=Amylocarpus encephaloides TaxID=45428 RepID=A0A9P8C934_9HELO|nr:Up-regulated during septation-domain-containing protein [Amylocarpus encephaloides]
MAHIADFMVDADLPNTVGLNNFIAREISPAPSHDIASEVSCVSSLEGKEKEKHVWRMHQPSESRKLHLFPSREKLSIGSTGRKSPDTTKEMAPQPTLPSGTGEKERSILGSALRSKSKDPKPKEQTLTRRRKVSVPELGPMTTVQEVAMDSPTIPGRPPLHERSISAPGNSWRQHIFGESMLNFITGPALDENAEMTTPSDGSSGPTSNPSSTTGTASPSPNRRPLSPKSLAPLVIPSNSAPQPQPLTRRPSGRVRSESTPPEVPPKSARMKDQSPRGRGSPYTPGSAFTTTPCSANTQLSISTLASSVGTTPTTAGTNPSDCSQWIASPPAISHTRGQSDHSQQQCMSATLSHRRGESEASIMDRGRPKKRADGSPFKPRTGKRSPAEEQKAFETLPQGTRANNATSAMSPTEIDSLRKQAYGQASRFDVLTTKDVELLSRELRGLDERCEYLRKTHRSLRSGRRNLHDRICSFLRSPRVARFSHESILKQEEALSELDSSIDDWVSKLEQAENRRTRVRQKLLEHVAAALIIENPNKTPEGQSAMNALQAFGESTMTPPRSPVKLTSPERLADRLAEEVKVTSPDRIKTRRNTRMSAESIRIYADSDVYALLADVEEEMNRMGETGGLEEKSSMPTPHGNTMTPPPEKQERMDVEFEALPMLGATVFEGLPSTRYVRPQAA